jgi:hypothetical protein
MRTTDRAAEYWDRPFAAAASMAAKYAALLAAVAQPEPERKLALRAAAQRWPGSLRECQLVDPQLYAARGAAAARGVPSAAEPRAAWRARGEQAICLWSDLHDLLRDQRDARGVGRRATPREAMIALAAEVGLDPATLAAELFGRPGLWRPQPE